MMPHFGKERGRTGVRGIHMQPEPVPLGDPGNRFDRIDAGGRGRTDSRHNTNRAQAGLKIVLNRALERFRAQAS